MPGSVSAVRAEIRSTEISSGLVRIGKEVGASGRAEGRSCYAVMSAAPEAARVHRRNHVYAVGEWAAPEVAADHAQRQTAVRAKHSRYVPSADNLIEHAVFEFDLVPPSCWQVVVENAIEYMGAVKKGWPILQVGIKACRVYACVILHPSQPVE